MTFHHKFRSGEEITLTFDMSTTPPGCSSSMQIPLHLGKEFEKWVETVVEPTVFCELNKKQTMWFAENGRKMAGIPDEEWEPIKKWGSEFEDMRGE